MGGSTKKAQKYVADRTGYTGSDAEAVANKGSEAVEYTKQKGTEIAAGADNIAQGFSKGMQGLGDTVVGGLQHNLGEVSKFLSGGGGGGDSADAQSSSANYSGSSKRSTSGAKKKGDLESGERKGATGKQKLYARRKTA